MRWIVITCIMLFQMPEILYAQDFGRLFTTPEQRQELDALRYQREVAAVELDINKEEEQQPLEEPLAPITLKGIIYRKDENNAAWINDVSTMKGDLSLEALDIKPGDISAKSVEIKLPGKDETIRLKVGEKYLPSSGQKVDLYPE